MSILDDRIGIVGVGHMGGGIARSAVRAGLPVTVYDVREDAVKGFAATGVETASSVTDLAQRCAVVSMVVVNDDQVRAVFEEILKADDPPSTVVIHSTILPSTVIDLAQRVAPLGIDVIDAPVSGGNDRSERGRLTLLIGGSESVIERCESYFEAISIYRFHIGEIGAGEAAKLVNNALTLGIYALTIEAMQLAAAYGIDEDTVTMFVPVSSGDNREVRTWGRHDRFRSEHTMAGTPAVYDMQTKDLVESVIAAAERNLNVPLIAVAAGLMPSKLMDRDQLLASRPSPGPIALCEICGQDLALPFRVHGVHPECRPFD